MAHTMIKDPEYGYLRVDPVPSAEEVDRFYREEFYARANSSYINDSSRENMEEEAEYHRRSYEDLEALIRRNIPISGGRLNDLSVADVGCGFGYFLRFLTERGARCYGVEPVKEGVDHCGSMGIEAFCQPIEALENPPNGKRVDLVTMVNVLEHLREPARIFKDLRANWLREEGYVLVRVPNEFNAWQTIADRAFDLKQWWVVPPQHINYFDRDSLNRLFSQCGYDVVDVTATFPLEMFLLMGDVYVGDPVLGKACHRKRVAFERRLDAANATDLRHRFYRSLAELGLGRELVVLAKARR